MQKWLILSVGGCLFLAVSLALAQSGSTLSPEDPHLTLIHDKVIPTRSVISIGSSGLGISGFWLIDSAQAGQTNRDFDETATGAIYCYDTTLDPTGAPTGNSEVFLMELTSATQMRIERQAVANCTAALPWTFTGAELTFQR